MKCNQEGCTLDAILVVYWPGKNPPPIYCANHALQAKKVLDIIGCDVVIEKIDKTE